MHIYLPVTLFLSGGGEEVVEATVTMVYIEPNAAEPTQDSTKDFTPRVETATVREKARDSTPRKPLRTEVRRSTSPGDAGFLSLILLLIFECQKMYYI